MMGEPRWLSSAGSQRASLIDDVFKRFDPISRKVSFRLQVTTSEKFPEGLLFSTVPACSCCER